MTIPTDWRALCAELLDEAIYLGQLPYEQDPGSELVDRARAALAQPEPKRPTDEELTLTYALAVTAAVDGKRGPSNKEDAEAAQLAGLRAVLASWGRDQYHKSNSCLHEEPDSYPSPCVFTVRIRKDCSRPVRPEAWQLDGKSYVFERGWTMDADDPYPGEVAWIACDLAYPPDAPTWIASGDLERCPIEGDNQ